MQVQAPAQPRIREHAARYGLAWTVASALLIALVPVLIVTTALNSLLFDADFYAQGQERYAIGRTTEYGPEALAPINAAIVEFFRSPRLPLSTALVDTGAARDVFNEREIGHMNDVRDIVLTIGRLQSLALVLALAIIFSRVISDGGALSWLLRRVALGAAATLVVVMLLGALTLVDFQRLFLAFHLASFDNDLWILDPERDNLIRFFPFEFWLNATVTLVLRVVLSAVAILAVALGAQWFLHGRRR